MTFHTFVAVAYKSVPEIPFAGNCLSIRASLVPVGCQYFVAGKSMIDLSTASQFRNGGSSKRRVGKKVLIEAIYCWWKTRRDPVSLGCFPLYEIFIFFHVKRKRSKRKRPCLAAPTGLPCASSTGAARVGTRFAQTGRPTFSAPIADARRGTKGSLKPRAKKEPFSGPLRGGISEAVCLAGGTSL